MNFDRDFCILDLETTGTNVTKDRIVEICVCKVYAPAPGETSEDVVHKTEIRTRRINPTVPIPKEASEVHGITDADVADKPTFKQIAIDLKKFIGNCDLVGFSIKNYDLPLLCHEFNRAGVDFDPGGRRIVDVKEIYHKMHPRDLAAAVREYLDIDHAGAHGAQADVLATWDVLKAMVSIHTGRLPADLASINEMFRDPRSIDVMGNFVQGERGPEFTFGKHKGLALCEVPDGYLTWFMSQSFLPDAKSVVARFLKEQRR